MHLMQGITTTRTKQRKRPKLTQAKLQQFELDMKSYNKHMRQIHCHSQQMTLDEYIDYRHGVYKSKKKEEFKPYVPPKTFQRTTDNIPSLQTSDAISGACTKRESPKYTGDLICGIATMHKSNAVPVMRGTKQAEDIAKMRR
jgi:hypothetical protein